MKIVTDEYNAEHTETGLRSWPKAKFKITLINCVRGDIGSIGVQQSVIGVEVNTGFAKWKESTIWESREPSTELWGTPDY